jgi:aldose 1-epimerase
MSAATSSPEPGAQSAIAASPFPPIADYAFLGTEYDLRRPRRIGPTRLDHCFADLDRDGDGLARVELGWRDDASAATLWIDASYPYLMLMLFTGDPLPEANRRALAVEPMTCPPNAFRMGQSLIALEPGASCLSEWGITPRPRLRGTS